ncbi:MAG: hypothetical protein QF921_18040 [Pseudomonadales bacterium]|nr:hypothetical protein [Pseudomonadales bacterium]MDP6470443.1 hypothetical protein [Pseudomonadales bacterium]MDP6827744.1 hypothetical protein [Pseudomonadales bacterium]MDP6973387.1 hypothetical protein [Pseudomonadales bacterium]
MTINLASIRVLEKLGFARHSHLDSYRRHDDTTLPGYLYRLDATGH